MNERRWFYQLGGAIERAQFLMNSLTIGTLFGVSFSVLIFGRGGTAQPMINAIAYGLPELLHTALLGIIFGPILVLASGLTCLWLGLFYAVIFVIGPLVASPDTFTLAARIILPSAGLVMAYTVVLAYANVAKRMRNILKNVGRTHLWSATIFLLSIIPIIGTVSYWVLLLAPSKSSSGQQVSALG